MRLKTFTARNMTEAMTMVRDEMGPEAVIVATTKTRMGNVEVRAAIDGPASRLHDPDARAERDLRHDELDAEQATRPAPAADIQSVCVRALFHHGVADPIAVAVGAHAGKLGAAEPVAALARALEARFAFHALPLAPERPVMLVGAPGAGKSSIAARLAARATVAGVGADLMCADPEREASRAQIDVYADIIGARSLQARSADALADWARERDEARAAFIDAPSTNPFDGDDVARIASLIRASGADPVFVFDAGVQPRDLGDQAAVFAELGCRRAIMTKCDVARRMGGALGVANAGLALTALSASPYVANGMTPATPLRLARLILDEAERLAAEAGDSEGEWR